MIEYTVKVLDNGDKFWFLNGKLHREDGPAVEYSDGSKKWYLNGKLHREDGPAIESSDGDKCWFLNGEEYTEEEYNKKMLPVKDLTIEELSDMLGYNIKIVKG